MTLSSDSMCNILAIRDHISIHFVTTYMMMMMIPTGLIIMALAAKQGGEETQQVNEMNIWNDEFTSPDWFSCHNRIGQRIV